MDPFLAQIMMFGGNFAPRGWAFCDGQLLPIASNSALYSILGTTYGGDGETTFGLPDLRGRSPVHSGNSQGPGLSNVPLGQKGGAETTSQIPNHTHTLKAVSDAPNATSGSGANLALAEAYKSGGGTLVNMAADSVATTGNGTSISIRNPYQGVNFIIALQGIYPSP